MEPEKIMGTILALMIVGFSAYVAYNETNRVIAMAKAGVI